MGPVRAVDDQTTDGPAGEGGLPEQHPGAASVAALQYTLTGLAVAAVVGFTRPRIDDPGIVRIDGEGADREHRLAVGQRGPVGAAVGGFPDAAARRPGVDRRAIGRIDGKSADPSAR